MNRSVFAVLAVLIAMPAGGTLTRGSALRPSQASKPAAQKPAGPEMNPDALDKLLAPIALYPDQLLGQMLLCSANPGKLAALAEWLAANEGLKGSALQDAALKSGFDASYVALVLFPDVVNSMASQIEWTTRLGEAFKANQSAVFASVQRLRAQAQNAGKLKDSPQQDVETRTTSSGQQVIVIEPANEQVVYVPQYNAQTVYTPTTTSSTVVIKEDDDADEAVAAGLIGFTAGIAIGAAIDNDYYYGPYGWHGGFYMYDDAWDDWYDNREDAREDWMDHREDLVEDRSERREDLAEERGDRASSTQQERTDRQQTRQENRPESQAQREQRRTDAQAAASQRTSGATSQESRGYSSTTQRSGSERSGTGSDAFSGYSSGKSERAASSRGQKSRSSSRSGGGGRRR